MNKKENPFSLTSPCKDCPFRTDNGFILDTTRVKQICGDILSGRDFHCHKTTEFDDDGETIAHPGEKMCAGAMILLEKANRPTQMMRIGERLGFYDHTKLNMSAPVFDDRDAMVAAYKERNGETK